MLLLGVTALLAATCSSGLESAAATAQEHGGGDLSGPARWTGHWSAPPTAVPSSKTVDGPLLGDGETGVVLGIDAASGGLTAFVSANSFWLLNSDHCDSHGRCSHGGEGLALLTSSAMLFRNALQQDDSYCVASCD